MGALGEWLTVKEAAELTGYDIQHIRRLARERKIETQKWGNAWMINRPSLMKYLETEGRGPKGKHDS
jgi:excisionase family DNA binding protein